MAEIKEYKNNEFEALREVILFEEFMNCLRPDIKMHIADREVNTVSDVAVLSDDYILVHPHPTRNHYDRPQQNNHRQEQNKTQRYNNYDRRPQQNNHNNVNNTKFTVSKPVVNQSMKPICAHCKKEGHIKQNCWALHKRQDKPKPVFAATCVVLKEGTTASPKHNCEANQQNGK